MQVLEAAEQKEPGDSSIASSLGTVYELRRQREGPHLDRHRDQAQPEGSRWHRMGASEDSRCEARARQGSELVEDPQRARCRVRARRGGGAKSGAERRHATGRRARLSAPGAARIREGPGADCRRVAHDSRDEIALAGSPKIALALYEFAAKYQPVRAEPCRQRTGHVKMCSSRTNKAGAMPASPKPEPLRARKRRGGALAKNFA